MMVLLEYIAVGFLLSIALIFLAKVVMTRLLQRDTDYYKDKYDQGGESDE